MHLSQEASAKYFIEGDENESDSNLFVVILHDRLINLLREGTRNRRNWRFQDGSSKKKAYQSEIKYCTIDGVASLSKVFNNVNVIPLDR